VKKKPVIKCEDVKTRAEKIFWHSMSCFPLCFRLNFNTCASVGLCCILRTISKALLWLLWGLPKDGTHGVPRQAGGDFVHLLCINSSACEVGFLSWSLDYETKRFTATCVLKMLRNAHYKQVLIISMDGHQDNINHNC